MQAPEGTAKAAPRRRGAASAEVGWGTRALGLVAILVVMGVIGSVAWLTWTGVSSLFGQRERFPVDAIERPAFPSMAWWTTPIERNPFMRLPVLAGDLHDVVEQPGRGHLWTVGAGGLLARSTDRGATWQRVDAIDWGLWRPSVAREAPLQQRPIPLEQQQQKEPLPDLAPLQKKGAVEPGLLDLLLPSAAAQSPANDAAPGGDAPRPALNAIAFFADGARAIVAADDGGVLITGDGGDSWRWVPLDSQSSLQDVAVSTLSGRAVVVGESGIIGFSEDGGESWRPAGEYRAAVLRAVAMDDDGVLAVAVGDGGTVVVSTDGGFRWQDARPLTDARLNDVVVTADGRHALAVGDAGIAVHSADAGASWQVVDTGTIEPLHAVAEPGDGTRLLAVGDGVALVADDLGAGRWRRLAPPSRIALRSLSATGDGEDLLAASPDGTVLALGVDGTRWRWLTAGARLHLRSVAMSDAGTRAVAVADGAILVSDDGGSSWQARAAGPDATLAAVAMAADGSRVIAVGATPTATQSRPASALNSAGAVLDTMAAILLSEDGGGSWSAVDPGGAMPFRDIALSADGRHAIAVTGADGATPAAVASDVRLSDDGGRSWRPASSPGLDLAAVDGSRSGGEALAVGLARGLAAIPAIARSTDGGETWNLPPDTGPNPPTDVRLSADGRRALAVDTAGNAHLSEDGGTTWRRSATGLPFPAGIVSPDEMRRAIVFGAGGALRVSDDAGATWRPVETGTGADLADIAFAADGRRGIAVGHGRILLTDDGGEHWRPVAYARYPAPWTYPGAALLGLIGFVVARRRSKPKGAPEADAGIAALAASDRPIGRGDRDPLDFDSVARGLSRFLRNAGTEPPITVGITGEWGTGKSSLMRLLHDDLAERDFRPVWFNAWHHQKGEQLLASLFEHIRGQGVPPLLSRMGLRYRVRLLWARGRDRWLRYGLMAAVFAAALVYALLHGDEAVALLDALGDTAGADGWIAAAEMLLGAIGLEGAGALAALLLPLLTALRALRAFGVDAGALMTGAAHGERGRAKLQPGARFAFAREFRDVTRALRPYTMVIFIDDLDRCQRDVVPEVLETVNFLMTSGECFVVLGMARGWVETCVGLAFRELAEEMDDGPEQGDGRRMRREFARDYLEKLLNVEVPVPVADPDASLALLAPDDAATPRPAPAAGARFAGLRELAPAVGLAAVVALGAWLGWALPSLEIRRAPPPIRAEVGTLTLQPTPGAGGASLAIPIERRRDPGGADATVVLGQVTFEGARGDVAIEFPEADGELPARPADVSRRITLGLLDTDGAEAALVLRLRGERPVTAPDAATEATTRDQLAALLDGEPESPAEPVADTVEDGQPGSPWPTRIGALLALALLSLVVVVAWTPPGVVERDSPAFLQALRLWHPWIVLRRNTPRAVKRYLNRVRYVAMRCKPDPERPGASALDIPEPVAVALTALDGVSVDHPWVRDDTRWQELRAGEFAALLARTLPGDTDEGQVQALAARLREIVDGHQADEHFDEQDRKLFDDELRRRYVRITGEMHTE